MDTESNKGPGSSSAPNVTYKHKIGA